VDDDTQFPLFPPDGLSQAEPPPQAFQQRVNAATPGLQDQPASARLADGSLVVVFRSKSTNDFGTSAAGNIQARIFNADGSIRPVAAGATPVLAAADGELLVNNLTNAMQWQPAVAPLADGGFVVVWSDEHLHDITGTANSPQVHYSVMGRAFNADGSPRGAQFRINEQDAGYEWNPQIVTQATGELVVAWVAKAKAAPALIGSDGRQKAHLVFRRFDGTSLEPLGGDVVATAELPVDQLPDADFASRDGIDRCYPTLIANQGEGFSRFALSWFAGNPDASGDDDRLLRISFTRGGHPDWAAPAADRIDAPSSPVGGVQLRDLHSVSLNWHPIGWGSPSLHLWSERNSSTGLSSIRARFFTPGGDPMGEAFSIVSDASRELRYPKALGLPDGRTLISYTVNSLGGDPAQVRIQAITMGGDPSPIGDQAVFTALNGGIGSNTSDADLIQLAQGQLALLVPAYNQAGDSSNLVLLQGLPLAEVPVLPPPPPNPDPDTGGGHDDCLILIHGIDNGPSGGAFSSWEPPRYPNSEAARKRFQQSLFDQGHRDSDLIQIDFEASSGWGAGNFAGSFPDYSVALVPDGALGPVSLPYATSTDADGGSGSGSLLWRSPANTLAMRVELQGTRLGSGGAENPGIGRIDDSNDVDRGFSTTPSLEQYSQGQWLELVPGSSPTASSLTLRLDRPALALGFYLIGRETGKAPLRISLQLADGSRLDNPSLWPEGASTGNLVPSGVNTYGDGSVQFIGLQVDADCSPIVALTLTETVVADAQGQRLDDIVALDDLIVLPVAGSGTPADLGTPEFPQPAKLHSLEPQLPGGTHLKLDASQPNDRDHHVFTSNAPDWIDVQANLDVTVWAEASGQWTNLHVASHVGSKAADGSLLPGSGEVLGLAGLQRFSLTTTDLAAGATTIVLPDGNNGFFLDDVFSDQQSDRGQSPAARLQGVEVIRMGDGPGTSIVDLTSTRFSVGDVVVFGGSIEGSRSVFWGSAADDTFVAAGAHSWVNAGAGHNEIVLAPYRGKDKLTYGAGGGANDVITHFEPWRDQLVLVGGSDKESPTLVAAESGPDSINGDALLSWGGNSLRLVGQASLAWEWSQGGGSGGGTPSVPWLVRQAAPYS